jgi:nitroreductase
MVFSGDGQSQHPVPWGAIHTLIPAFSFSAMDALELLKSRRSVRDFTGDPIPEDVVEDILECARLAPTARNAQPWLIGAVTDGALLSELGGLADHGAFIADAAVCFTILCLRDEKYFLEDGCAATMNIIIACEAHGLGSCWVAGDKKGYAEEVRTLLNVPADYTLVALVAAGYPASTSAKQKKDYSDVCFRDRL